MKITLDKEADAVYIYFKNISKREVANTVLINDNTNIDLNKNGKTLGIEILNANKNLPAEMLNSAAIIKN